MIIDRYLLKQFLSIFFSALALFMMLVILIDLFLNLTRYLSNGASLMSVLEVSFFYLPKSLSYALPVSLLFASAYTLGDLNTRNELVTIIGSGIPFWRFCCSLIAVGILASFFAFFFEDRAVIPSLRIKNRMARELLHTNTDNLSGIVIKLDEGRQVYAVDYYDRENMSLNGVTIVELDAGGNLLSMLHAPLAVWKNGVWEFTDPLLYSWRDGFLRPGVPPSVDRYREEPETFRRSSIAPEDLNVRDAGAHIRDLRRAGLPVSTALADYHHRFSFSAVSFVVVFLSLSVSGRFKKNIMFLSLLSSLGTAVIYYVIEMVSMMSAKAGILPPFWGAWFPVFVCTAAGFFLLRSAKT